MISLVIFLLFVGLIVFGPKKTIEMTQSIARTIGEFKQNAGLHNNTTSFKYSNARKY